MGVVEILEKNIMQALKQSGLKRKNAADLLKIDPTYFNRMLKSGNWRLHYLEALADLLRLPLWRLFFDGEGAKKPGGRYTCFTERGAPSSGEFE